MSEICPDTNPVKRLADYIERVKLTKVELGDEFHYASLPLCVIGAVFSIGVTAKSADNAVERFCERNGWPQNWRRLVLSRAELGAGSHPISELLALYDGLTPEDAADKLYSNRQRTSPRSGILKAEAVRRFAEALRQAGIETFEDMTPDKLEQAEAIILGIPGQSSGISFDYFQMLAGNDDLVKPDRMVQRFVGEALKTKREQEPRQASLLVQLAARELNKRRGDDYWTPQMLDNAIWQRESGRDVEGA